MSEDDWLAGWAPAPPTPDLTPIVKKEKPSTPKIVKPIEMQSPGEWTKGTKRRTVIVLCCEECGSVEMKKKEAYGLCNYWQCDTCNHRQKEIIEIGKTGVRAWLE
jgi:hypothetical protein